MRLGASPRVTGAVALMLIVAAIAVVVFGGIGSAKAPPDGAGGTAAAAGGAGGGAGQGALSGAPLVGSPSQSVSVEWVGDMAMSTADGLPPGGVQAALAPVASLLRDADITTGNLEGTLSTVSGSKCAGATPGDCFAFQAPPSTAFALHALHFGLVNQANNHALDFGPAGQAQTIAALNAAHVAFTGQPGQITVLPVNGTKVAFLGFAPYTYTASLLNIPAAQALVREARRRAPLVVVFIHAGAEGADQTHTPYGSQYFLGEDRGDARAFAHAVIDAGATMVLGSGPHVIRGVELYHGHVIAYSLGNFVGYQTLSGGGVLNDSGIIRVTVNGAGKLLAARWFSIELDNGLPRLDPTRASLRLVASMSAEDFPSDHPHFSADGHFILPR